MGVSSHVVKPQRNIVKATSNNDEKTLYTLVETWMRRKFRCFQSGTNLGFSFSRVDVLGVRDIGGSGSGEIETIGIEVKCGAGDFATACGQAVGYTVYANRVYLAQKRQQAFKQKELEIASHLGVGLVHINQYHLREALSAPYHSTLPGITIDVLDKLDLGRCQLCQSFFITGTDQRNERVSLSVRNAVKAGKAYQFFTEAQEARKIKARLLPDRSTSYDSRYICPECLKVMTEIAKNSPVVNA